MSEMVTQPVPCATSHSAAEDNLRARILRVLSTVQHTVGCHCAARHFWRDQR